MLSSIDISYCNFSGEIPNSMASLTQLLYLDMSFNNFVGSIPSFSMSKNLTFSGPLNELSNVSACRLETFDLSHNNLEGPIPMSLFSFHHCGT
ncbi:hypothetical protein SLA2020_423140 [Shorea laevis]